MADETTAFWRDQLAAGWAELDLPTDQPRPPMASFRRSDVTEPWLAESHLESQAAKLGVDPAGLAVACVVILLARYTGQDRVGVALVVPAADGHTPLLPLSVDVPLGANAGDMIPRITAHLEALRQHAAVSWNELERQLPSSATGQRSPLLQVLVEPQGFTGYGTSDASSAAAYTPDSDLHFRLLQDETSSELRVDFDADIFAAETIQRMLRHYQTLLHGACATPQAALDALPLIDEAERRALIERSTARRRDAAVSHCLHRQFEQHAEQAPERTALIWPGSTSSADASQTLSYGELNQRANRLARQLVASGVSRGALVALYLERGIEAVVAQLAVLKTGAAYLPMDQAYPADRLEFMLTDAGCPVVITQRSLASQLPASKADVVVLDELTREQATRPDDNLDANLNVSVDLDDCMYVIYTSGSTGQPKGVEVTQRNAARLFSATQPWFGFGADDVWTLFHSAAFDFSVWELWGALAYGGQLVVVPYLTSRSPEAFHRLLVDHQVTVLNQTPSAFYQLIQADRTREASALESLRFVIFGGEALELQSLAPWISRYGDDAPQLINMYGITETTVHVTYRRIRQTDLHDNAGSVIGQPIPDLALLVLDGGANPVPPGVPGEIYVGGAGVARGYLNRAALTAERFVDYPLSDAASLRLYRTGDLARAVGAGDLQYLGRVDQQVKLRGFRIELGEIESALNQFDGVAQSSVSALDDADGHRQLVAYVVPDGAGDADSAELDVQQLQQALKRRLPEYMVPSGWVVMPALPLTPHGKVDRRNLPRPQPSPASSTYEAPQSRVERLIADVYRDVLRLERVGVTDNFFELGGDSLRVGQVVGRLREVLDVDLQMVKLFEHPTIRALATYLQTTEPEGQTMQHVQQRAQKQLAARARRKQHVRERRS